METFALPYSNSIFQEDNVRPNVARLKPLSSESY